MPSRRLGLFLALILLAVQMAARAEPSPASGDFAGTIAVDGRKLYLECKGTGSPTVVLISGFPQQCRNLDYAARTRGRSMSSSAVSKFTRVCAYDRPGTILDATHLSRSDSVPMPRTAEKVVFELHDLLDAAKIEVPHVFVAHSLGGLFAQLYAAPIPARSRGWFWSILVRRLARAARPKAMGGL